MFSLIVSTLSSFVILKTSWMFALTFASRNAPPLLSIVDRTISRGGWRIVALIRLSPAFPYSASNYLFGVTGVSFLPFLISSGIFTLPGAFAYLYFGYVGAEAVGGSSRSSVEWALLVLGLGVTIVAIAYVTILARRGLAELE